MEDGKRMLNNITRNITLDEYLSLLDQVKQAALRDMDTFPEKEKGTGRNVSFLGTRLRYRDDEDCLYADCSSPGCQPFTRLHPYLWKYLKEESADKLDDQDLFDDSVENKFYWEVTKYIQLGDRIYEQYDVTFSLKMELLSVQGHPCGFERWSFQYPEYLKYFTEEQGFIMEYAEQIREPLNVVLPYQPGDILYIDANPFGRPFYAVYCAETISDRDHFEWTKREYGFYKREHPCLYISDDYKCLDFTNLTGRFTDYIPFPYAPLDRIRVVDSCDNQYFLKASKMLKENPDIFWKWYNLKKAELEKYIV